MWNIWTRFIVAVGHELFASFGVEWQPGRSNRQMWGQEKDVRPFHFYYHDGQISFSIISLLLKFPFKQDAMNSLIVVHFP